MTNSWPFSTGYSYYRTLPIEELLMSQIISQEALTRLLVEKGIFTKEEFYGMVKAVDQEMQRKRRRGS
jgi:hypothetical protein